MATTFEKLNLKNQQQIVVLNAPESFETELAALRGLTVARSLKGLKEIEFSLAFVIKEQQIDTLGRQIGAKAKGDALVWFAYPKGTSKKYKSEIDRDHGWEVLGQLGFEVVRLVAIDEDWSALRFRRVEFVKTMTRATSGRMTAEGKARARKG